MGICQIFKLKRKSPDLLNESMNSDTIDHKDHRGIDYDKWEVSQLNKNNTQRINIVCDSGKPIHDDEKKVTVENFNFLNVLFTTAKILFNWDFQVLGKGAFGKVVLVEKKNTSKKN